MLESMGFPLPAESLIIGSALYAATTHHLQIEWIALAAVIGAIMGDNFGYLIGRAVGYPFLSKYGKKIGLTPERLTLGSYLFKHRGGIVVFTGRFVAILRLFSALLAGALHMPWGSFLFYNAIGGIAWAGGYAFATYYLGKSILNFSGPFAITLGVIVVVIGIAAFFFLKKNEKRLTVQAMVEAEKEARCPHRRWQHHAKPD